MITRENNYSLLKHNTFGIDVKADRFIEYSTIEDLEDLIRDKEISKPFLHIGAGSNFLFTEDFHGTVLHSAVDFVSVSDNTDRSVIVKAGAGTCWDEFVGYCVEHGWYGIENLSGIPGETGSAAVQNIGAYGVEIKDLLLKVDTLNIITGEERSFSHDECHYGYRDSIFKKPEMKDYIITDVVFKLSKIERYNLSYQGLIDELKKDKTPLSLKRIREAVLKIRDSKLPDWRKLGNAGSFFKNPVVTREKLAELQASYPDIPSFSAGRQYAKLSGGWLIEQCGWKGKQHGNAGVYEKQALVLVNLGNASGKEIEELSEMIISSVQEKFGITLERETEIVKSPAQQ